MSQELVDPKQKAKEVLKELIKLTKSGKLPQELYEVIVKYAGKQHGTEQAALLVLTNMVKNFIRSHKKVQDPDKKDVDKLLNEFKKRRDNHGLFFNKWKNYMNDPLGIWMFDYQKIWEAYSNDKL